MLQVTLPSAFSLVLLVQASECEEVGMERKAWNTSLIRPKVHVWLYIALSLRPLLLYHPPLSASVLLPSLPLSLFPSFPFPLNLSPL